MKNSAEFEKAIINQETARFQAEILLIASHYYSTDMSDLTYNELLNAATKKHAQTVKDMRDYIIPNMKRDIFGEG